MEGARQEVELKFGGKTFQLRPTFEKLVAVEAALNQPCRQIGMKMLGFDAAVSEIAAVLGVVLRDQKDAPKTEDIGSIIMEDGYADLMLPLGQFLTRAQKGNKQHLKEAEEEAKRLAALSDPPKPQGDQGS